jgi:hypothetical protein
MTSCKIATVALASLLTSAAPGVTQDVQYSPAYPPAQTVSGAVLAFPPYDPSQQQDIQPAQVAPDDPNTPDPALANFAPAGHFQYPAELPPDPATSAQLQSDGSYQQPAAISDDNAPDTQADQPPPDLFDYDQPFAPGPYFLWIPGYWSHNRLGFFWVPGLWTRAPFIGALWTPPYWNFSGGAYRFHSGYWGAHIGYYGGVNYGFGYIGAGFFGGYWRGKEFFYNAAVTRVPATISTVYRHTPIYHGGVSVRTSYNGGPSGLQARPLRSEIAAAHEPRLPEMRSQVMLRRQFSHMSVVASNRNQGHPVTAAIAPRTAINHAGIMPSIASARTIAPPATLQDAQHLETQRQENLQRQRQQIEVRRAAGEPVTGASSGVSTMPGSGSTSIRRIPSGQTGTTYTTTTSDSSRTSTQTTTHYEPRPSTNSTSTSSREPEPARTEPRPEPARTEPAHVEPARTEPVATNPAEPAHATEPATHSAGQPAHPAEPASHPAPHPAPPPPRPASH